MGQVACENNANAGRVADHRAQLRALLQRGRPVRRGPRVPPPPRQAMSYQIADQPLDTSLRDYVVRPSAPLLAAMLCGAWLAWPWFAFNAIAMGSPTRRREIALCVAAFAGTAVLAAIVVALFEAGLLPRGAPLRLALLAIVSFKLGISYYLEM